MCMLSLSSNLVMLVMSLIMVSLACAFTSLPFKLYWNNLAAMVSKFVIYLTNYLRTFHYLGWYLVSHLHTLLEI